MHSEGAENAVMMLTRSEMGIRIMASTRIRGQPQAGIWNSTGSPAPLWRVLVQVMMAGCSDNARNRNFRDAGTVTLKVSR